MTNQEYAKITSKNLKRIAYEHQKSQADIAKDLGINKGTVSSWMTGARVPRMDKIDLLCKYFNCKREDLMEPENTNNRLSLEEHQVIEAYRNAPAHIQEAIKTMLKVGD